MEHRFQLEDLDLGYDDFFESNRETDGLPVARVVVQHKKVYGVKNADGEYQAKITGKHMFNASSREDYPAVGDWVTITDLGDQRAVIHRVLPRQTIMKRKHSGRNEIQIIAANIDAAFIIESVDRDFNLNRIERYFAMAKDGGIQPAIILNKIDLISKDQLQSRIDQIKNRFGDIDFIPTSTLTHEGLGALKAYTAKGKTYCFLGSSGVGKSSLINKLIGKDVIKTGEINIQADRGRHTTTSRQMYFLEEGGIVIDNPGMREVGMTEVSDGINRLFDEITLLARTCKYVDCTHIHEPGCAVLSAIESGQLDEEKYQNYLNLKKEAEHYEMTQLEKKKKDNEVGKFFKKAKKQLKRYGHKDY
ncbi:MAG: ribosome small subunit-dependent GTPase A [Planctomycetota bacterium]|jgi:ribosome biogenesis GTPase